MGARDPKETILQIFLPLSLSPQHLVSEHPYKASAGFTLLPLHSELQSKPETSEITPRFYLAIVWRGKIYGKLRENWVWPCNRTSLCEFPSPVELPRSDIHCSPGGRKKWNSLLWDHFHLSFIWDSTTESGLMEAVKYYLSIINKTATTLSLVSIKGSYKKYTHISGKTSGKEPLSIIPFKMYIV